METLPDALKPLAAYNQFVIQKLILVNDHYDKVPVDPGTLYNTNAMDPRSWLSADRALQLAKVLGEQFTIGFVLTADDPFIFVDVDNCLQADNTWSGVANEMMTELVGAAVEVSAGGRGLHVIGTGTVPEHTCKNISNGLELYHESRIINLTGINAVGSASVDITVPIQTIAARYFPPRIMANDDEWTTTHVEGSDPILDDNEMVERAKKSISARSEFQGRATFKDLWECNKEILVANYEKPQEPGTYDGSQVDMALLQHLAFWTGNNCERMLKLMLDSDLKRDKWESHKNYLTDSIIFAKQRQTTFYKKAPDLPPMGETTTTDDGYVLTSGYQFLTVQEQLKFFKDCFYITELDRVLNSKGTLLRQSQFKALYGGYIFSLDAMGEKDTKNAWEVFTESQAVRFPKVDNMLFKPDAELCEIIKREGKTYINSYKPIEVERKQGDISPFLDHLTKIIPNERDQKILLSYMAACVQHKGVKFQWAPLLQGVEGNGKTLFSNCVAQAVGMRYSHFPNAKDIDNKFNSWMLNKLFIGVEDIYVPDNRLEMLETLKPMITASQLEIQLKGVDQVTCDICCNFMLNSNRRDALRKNRNDRRFATFFTAQQEEEHLKRDGLTGNYFPKLYDWLNDEGYAIVSEFLYTYKIENEFNPARGCHRAPITSTTEEAILAGRGGVESEIMEAIDEGRIGFAGGWVSSVALDKLLVELRANRQIPQNKRRDLMRSLGYDFHPALKNGRSEESTPVDGKRPRLYVQIDNALLVNLKSEEVTRAYVTAQNGPLGAAQIFADNPAAPAPHSGQ